MKSRKERDEFLVHVYAAKSLCGMEQYLVYDFKLEADMVRGGIQEFITSSKQLSFLKSNLLRSGNALTVMVFRLQRLGNMMDIIKYANIY